MNTLHAASPEDPKVLEFAESPGRRLRVHRQAKGLEVERIATQMHLRPAIVEALEQDRYDELPGPVFVIGYLRNYARLVGLDPQPLIEAYRAANPGMEAPTPRVSIAPASRPEIGSSHLLVRLGSLALIAGVIALLALWWQNRAEQMAPLALDGEEGALSMPEGLPGADPIEEIPEIAGMDEEAPADAGLTEPPPADLGPTPAGGLTLPPLPEQPDAGAADSDDATAAAQPLDETTDTATAEASGDGQTTADTPAEPEAPAEAAPSPTEVAMEFSGPSWIQVKDASGAVVLTGSMVKGARRVVEGSPPFAFIIGNASNTRLSVGGAAVDLGARARGNVARFTLNPGETE